MRFEPGRKLQHYWLLSFLTVLLMIGLSNVSVSAQEPKSDLDKVPQKKELRSEKDTRERTTTDGKAVSETSGKKSANENWSRVITDEERDALRREDTSEASAAVMPYINNFFATTRLGPEDVITVDVFDQPIYSRSNIVVPPNGKINYPLIGQVMVAGRTTDEIEKDIIKRLEEYIIDPKVTVQMVQVHSLKYMVIGDVSTPGIYEMTRRMSLSEAVAKAGYLSKYGDRSKVSILRMQPNGQPSPIKVNLKEIEKGNEQDPHLVPGDTIIVGSTFMKKVDQFVNVVALFAWMKVLVD